MTCKRISKGLWLKKVNDMIRTPAQYTQYFKDLVTNHKQLTGFYRITFTGDISQDFLLLAEFLTNQKDIKTPCMLRVNFNGNILDRDSDNLLQETKGAFVLLDMCSDKGDFDRQEEIFDATCGWGYDIAAYIKEDVRRNDEGWMDIQFQDWDFDFIGPLLGKYYGTMFNFKYLVVVNEQLQYDASKWNNPL